MPKYSQPFSFIRWEECFQSEYDYYCQELWDWSDYVDALYLPDVPFARLPWNDQAALSDIPSDDIYFRPGTISVWIVLSREIQLEDYFLCDDDACEWEPFDVPLFWEDLGFILYPYRDEIVTAPDLEPVSNILNRFVSSKPEDFASCKEAIVESCRRRSITKAHGLYFAYNYDFFGSPVFGRFCYGLVEYLGSFSIKPSSE